MPIEQKIFTLLVSVLVFVIILDLIRRRKLREEYSWLWALTGIVIIILAAFDSAIMSLSNLLKAKAPSNVVFFLCFVFLLMLNLHFSVSISNLKTRIKELTQKIGLMDVENSKTALKKNENKNIKKQ